MTNTDFLTEFDDEITASESIPYCQVANPKNLSLSEIKGMVQIRVTKQNNVGCLKEEGVIQYLGRNNCTEICVEENGSQLISRC